MRHLKKYLLIVFVLGVVLLTPVQASARQRRIGDMGFHGGISESRHLPRTTETIILEQGSARNRTDTNIRMDYREIVFLQGFPWTFEGTKEVRNGNPDPNATAGTFRVEHRVFPSASTPDDGVIINRTQIFDVDFQRQGNQMIYTYIINRNTWRETITFPDGAVFVLDHQRSSMVVSVIEHSTPGVNYYRGDISARLFYVSNGETVTVEISGSFHGYSSVWSATETHRLDVQVDASDWALVYQIRPSVTVNKVLQFVQNEPTVISFEGNFRELHQSFAGLRYDIFFMPPWMQLDEPDMGTLSLDTFNVFEQLPAPDLTHLRGHSAEDDIHRLFAMQVLTGEPRFYVPEQAITRGQFLTALARAISLPVEEPAVTRNRQPVTITLFSDVDSNRPEFRYIQAVNRAGIGYGRADGSFHFDYPISRQEAFATIIRAMGLTSMALNPTVVTAFADSDSIANWAMRDLAVALQLGLIAPDANGNIHPNRAISKAEAATLLNSLIDYLREGIVSDYGEQIVNIPR